MFIEEYYDSIKYILKIYLHTFLQYFFLMSKLSGKFAINCQGNVREIGILSGKIDLTNTMNPERGSEYFAQA